LCDFCDSVPVLCAYVVLCLVSSVLRRGVGWEERGLGGGCGGHSSSNSTTRQVFGLKDSISCCMICSVLLQEEALKAFVEPETLDGSNQYFCEKCACKCDAHKVLRCFVYY